MNNIPIDSESKLDAPTLAYQWLVKGITPVPLKPRSKKPAGGKGWNKVKINKDNYVEYFRKNSNVGGLWGKASRWLVDVDLDCPEAIKLAPLFLPKTFIYGRENSPRSHHIFRCKEIETQKFRTAALGMLVEIRSSGSQSVLPGSIHPDDGDFYLINKDRDFFSLSKDQLTKKVSELAAAAIIVKRYPGKGSRHDYVHALAGGLLHDGWKAERLQEFLEKILSVVSDDDPQQRQRTIRNTIEHYRKKAKVYGWTTLQTWIPEDEQLSVKKWLGVLRTIKVVEISKEDKEAAREAREANSPLKKFKSEWLNIPGIVGDLMRYADRLAIYKQPLFSLSSALAGMALMTGNRYVVDGLMTPLQPYIMMLAPSSGGKNSALTSVLGMAKKLDLKQHIFQGFQSYHSMLDHLSQSPNMALWSWDEAARKLKSAQNPSSADYQMLTHVTELYGAAKDFIPGMPGRKNPIPELNHPFLVVLAAAQPKPLTEAISQGDIQTGLLSRFVLFDASDKVPEFNYDCKSLFPAKIEEYHQKLKTLAIPGGDSPFIRIRFDPEAFRQFQEFRQYTHQKSYLEESPLWGRANQNALIFAGLVAVGVNCKIPIITPEIATWAIELISWSCKCWEYRMEKGGSTNRTEAQSKKVEEVIRAAPEYAARGKYRPSQKKLLLQGWMPRSVLLQECRSVSKKELDDILSQLEEMELIDSGEPKDDSRTIVYRARVE